MSYASATDTVRFVYVRRTNNDRFDPLSIKTDIDKTYAYIPFDTDECLPAKIGAKDFFVVFVKRSYNDDSSKYMGRLLSTLKLDDFEHMLLSEKDKTKRIAMVEDWAKKDRVSIMRKADLDKLKKQAAVSKLREKIVNEFKMKYANAGKLTLE